MERMTYRQYQAVEREMRREERKRRRKKALTILVVLLLLLFVLLIFLDSKGIIDAPSVSSKVSQAWETFRDSRQMPAQAAVEGTTQETTEETSPPQPETTPATMEETTQVTTEEETLPPETTQETTEETSPPQPETTSVTVEETTQVTTEEETLPPEPETTPTPTQETTPAPTQASTPATMKETTQVTTEEETLPLEPETTPAPIQETTPAPTQASTPATMEETTQETTPAAPAEPETTEWMYFYHWEVLEDGDSLNDYNFGCNPLDEEGAVLTAEWLHSELVRRMTDDPALGAAAMAWVEINTGTRFLPGYYNPDREEGWMNIINRKIDEFILSPDCYRQCLEPFIRYLTNANGGMDVRTCAQVTDQMYMYSDGRTKPQVVVLESKDCSGYELVYTFLIKGNVHEVAFRANCGFQPTGVTDKTNIVLPPEPEPEPETEPVTEPETEPVTEPETEPWVEPPTEPVYQEKDPALATYEYVEPNDDPGPGPDTNTGVGSTVSAAEQDWNSNYYDSYEGYVEAVQELEIINESQRTGEDDNTPSYIPPVEYVTNPAEPEAEPETVPLTEHNNGDVGGSYSEIIVDGSGQETVVKETMASIDEVALISELIDGDDVIVESGDDPNIADRESFAAPD